MLSIHTPTTVKLRQTKCQLLHQTPWFVQQIFDFDLHWIHLSDSKFQKDGKKYEIWGTEWWQENPKNSLWQKKEICLLGNDKWSLQCNPGNKANLTVENEIRGSFGRRKCLNAGSSPYLSSFTGSHKMSPSHDKTHQDGNETVGNIHHHSSEMCPRG